MKIKIILALSIASLTLLSAACGNSTDTTANTNSTDKSNTAALLNANRTTAANNTVPATNAAANTVSAANTSEKSVTQADAQEKQEIFQLIKKDKEVSEFLKDAPDKAGDLMKSLTVRKMDLNADGQPEYVAVIEDGVLCGAHANCPHWIYSKKGGEYNLLRRTSGQVIKLEKTSTKGYLDLRSEGSDTATTNSYVIFKFDGSKYQPAKCVSRDESVKPVKETPGNCKDYGEEIQ